MRLVTPIKRPPSITPNAAPSKPATVIVQGSSLPIAISCVSLGIGATLLAQTSFLKKLFPAEPEPQKTVVQTTDNSQQLEELMNQYKRISNLEYQLQRFREDLEEKKSQPPPQPTSQSSVNTVELSQVIEAVNLANSSHFKSELEKQRKLLTREHMVKLEGVALEIENKYKPTLNKIKGIEAQIQKQEEILEQDMPARKMWISCQSLLKKMRNQSKEPLEKDPAYQTLCQFANSANNPVAKTVIESLPLQAVKEGIHSEEALIERFFKFEKVCRRVALVDDKNGSLVNYLVSYLQSLFIFDNIQVSEEEVEGRQLVNPSSWNTFDILARVKYCLKRHKFEQALRYANQLKGQARVVARDWISDAKVYLETAQAFNLLSTHTESIALDALQRTHRQMYMGK